MVQELLGCRVDGGDGGEDLGRETEGGGAGYCGGGLGCAVADEGSNLLRGGGEGAGDGDGGEGDGSGEEGAKVYGRRRGGGVGGCGLGEEGALVGNVKDNALFGVVGCEVLETLLREELVGAGGGVVGGGGDEVE